MKLFKICTISLMALFAVSSTALAGDFAWTRDFNIQAQADPSGFRAELSTRFKIGDVYVDAVLSNCERPADAYIMLRLGEMSHLPTEYVIERYKANKGKGWGVLAKSLGIKPGSGAFHALKQGHDMHTGISRVSMNYISDDYSKKKSKPKNKGKGKGKKKK